MNGVGFPIKLMGVQQQMAPSRRQFDLRAKTSESRIQENRRCGSAGARSGQPPRVTRPIYPLE